MTRGGTKLPTSISRTPAAAIAAIQRTLSSVVMRVLAICSPSRGPTSQMETNSLMDGNLRGSLDGRKVWRGRGKGKVGRASGAERDQQEVERSASVDGTAAWACEVKSVMIAADIRSKISPHVSG